MKYNGKVLRGGEVMPLANAKFDRPVVTLGFFDGVHTGHQALLGEVVHLAKESGGEAVAVTFDKHPKEVLTGEGPLLLTSLEERERLIGELGLTVVELEFTKELSNVGAEDFVRDFFVGVLNVGAVVLGPETRFGRNGAGNPELLNSLGEQLGFGTKIVDFKKEGSSTISSSIIREKISAGDLESTEKLLGRPVTITGVVVKGKGRGKELGFPTANLNTGGLALPPHGVYAVRVSLSGQIYPGALSIGTAPTFGDLEKTVVEVYIIDFDRDIYGSEIRLEILKKLRDQEKFESLEALKRAIDSDIFRVKEIFG